MARPLFHNTVEEHFANPSSEVDFHLWHNTTTTIHDHTYYEINLITKGKCYHMVNNQKMEVAKGTLFIVPPAVTHQLIKIPDQSFSLLNISFTAEFLEYLLVSYPKEFFNQIDKQVITQEVDKVDFKFLSHVAYHKILGNINFSQISTQLWISTALYFFYVELNKQRHNRFPAFFQEILDNMSSHENINKRLNEIPIVKSYSPTTLSKYFKEFLNTTPNNYFITIKLDYACQLLSKTDYSVFTISEKLGYTSISHFNRIFRKNLGVTPSEYRNGKLDT